MTTTPDAWSLHGNRDEPADSLSQIDAEMLDLAASAGFEREVIERALATGLWRPSSGPARTLDENSRARLGALVELMGLLETYPVDDAALADGDLLIAATLTRIDRHVQGRTSVAPEELEVAGVMRRRIRMPDFISVAAVLLILVGAAIPVLQRVRVSSMDMACANNLRQAATGFSMYAGDFAGRMPTFTAGASRLFPRGYEGVEPKMLAELGYCEFGHLGCPGHHHEGSAPAERMYGHQMLSPGDRINWISPVRLTVVIGDRSPLIEAYRNGYEIAPEALSGSHGGRGQNVLQIDGSVRWLRMPVLDGRDNIWLPHGMQRLQPDARPAAPNDAFIVH